MKLAAQEVQKYISLNTTFTVQLVGKYMIFKASEIVLFTAECVITKSIIKGHYARNRLT